MMLENICPPALIYIFFSLTHIIIDTANQRYNTAFLKFWVALVFTILLNYLCERGLGIISWFIVFTPFILMTVIISILLLVFGLDPKTGKIKMSPHQQQQQQQQQRMLPIDPREESRKRAVMNETQNQTIGKNIVVVQPVQAPSTTTTPTKNNIEAPYFDNYNDANVNTIQ
jgi:predicted membrane protein